MLFITGVLMVACDERLLKEGGPEANSGHADQYEIMCRVCIGLHGVLGLKPFARNLGEGSPKSPSSTQAQGPGFGV